MAIEFRRDGPWELPDGWVWARLRDVCKHPGRIDPARQLTSSFRYIDLSAVSDGKVTQPQNLPVANAPSRARQPVMTGDVLLSCVRVYLQNNAIVTDELDGSVASSAFCVLRPSDAIAPRYLFWFIHSRKFTEILIPLQRGNSPPAVLDEDVRDQLVPIPPAAEQRRIVARIDELFTEIADGEAALARARDDLDTWRHALLKAAVTGELTHQWREHNSPTETGQEMIARWRREAALARGELDLSVKPNSRGLPETWAWSSVGEAGEIRLGRQRAPQHHTGTHMRPYLRVANVFEGRLDLSDVKWMNFTPQEFKIYQLDPGDVLLNEGQTPELLGRPSIYQGEIDGCCFQNTLLRFRANIGLSPEFALLVFRHYLRSGRFKREARITTNLAHLSQTRCAAIEFPIPSTTEQIEIVQRVRLLEEQAFEQFEHIEISAIGPLRQSVLKAAFEGQLIQQDPKDEPAGRLLARLSEQSGHVAHSRRTLQNERAALAAE